MSGLAAIDSMIARMRKLTKIADLAAVEAAPLVQAALRSTAAAGTAPDGTAWRKKKDGSPALPDAASAVTVTAEGHFLRVETTGPYAIQQQLKSDYRRPTIPSGGKLPPDVVKAIKEGAERAFQKAMNA